MENLSIRSAVYSDVLDILKWRNHPSVILASLSSHKIELNEHTQWFYERMKNKEIYLFEKDGQKAGVISFKTDNNEKLWSFYLNPEYMKKGLGKSLMILGLETARLKGYSNLTACVLNTNSVSLKLHQDLGFKVTGCYEDIIYLSKELNNG